MNLKKMETLVISILIPLAVGTLSAVLTQNTVNEYYRLIRPPFSPSASVFPVVWTVLYILMGISAYLVYSAPTVGKKNFKCYFLQLVFNFGWSLIFFGFHLYLFSFLWLIVLIVFIVCMIKQFHQVSPIAAYLQIPYLLWCLFAAYLNLGIYFLNS